MANVDKAESAQDPLLNCRERGTLLLAEVLSWENVSPRLLIALPATRMKPV